MSNSRTLRKSLIEAFIESVVSSMILEQGEPTWLAATPPSRPKAISAPKQQFDMNTFKSQPTPETKIRYLQSTLRQIGEGSTRLVFQLNPTEVIKMAKPGTNGIKQNGQEANACALKTSSANLFARVFEVGPNFEWLRAEFAAPIQTSQFESLTKIPWEQFDKAMMVMFPESQGSSFKPSEEQKALAQNLMQTNPLFRNLINTIKQCHYTPDDIVKIDSWGAVGNRPVIVDYGLSE